ncbi:MAG: hypothetical protein M1834_007236 [Cirrosporium novae-zelandiae]|nr:MAG: hypothetical protein M1834_007236 [Cirrosporium novae-zelandiae]
MINLLIFAFYYLLLAVPSSAALEWPYGPLSTESRWIVNANGDKVIYAGANWPGAADTMIPEGLQYSSIADIVSKIKNIGMNVIRLTYAIQMIDEIYENGQDTDIKTSLINALGETNGTSVYNAVVENNPQFGPTTTRLDVFDAIAAECAEQEIYVHLDNHISKAEWCCSSDDGNSWFWDTYFNVTSWKRGLSYMATHAVSWTSLTSMSLRNELREPDNSTLDELSYNWHDWYINVVAAADAINAANPDVLIFLSGLNFDTEFHPIPAGSDLGSGIVFNKSDFAYADKLVLEIHDYATVTSCSSEESRLYYNVLGALNTSDSDIVNIFPVVMTEWGLAQTTSGYTAAYASCLADILPEQQVGWMIWVLAGSYYIREGTQDYEESWGLFDHEWDDWRCPDCIEDDLIPMINATLQG